MKKRWDVAEPVPDEAFKALRGLPKSMAAVLWRRGIRSVAEADAFLNPSWKRDVHDPFLFNDMRKAVYRLMTAVRNREKIVVHGDYDADGVSGSVILHGTLKTLGGDVSVYLPHREKDGYGMNAPAIERMAADGAKVIVTCDCGISNAKEIALAVSLGMDVIVTDHHTLPPELPPAYAILHPLREGETYPFKYLTGGGVAFKLCQALWKEGNLPEGQEKWLLDMVSISTVADMGKLVGENRALVHYGLIVLNKTRRLGLERLVKAARRGEEQLDASSIGFRIAPRINAAGRMDHASAAFDLLVAETDADAVARATVLDDHNRDRQAATAKIVEDARVLAAEECRKAAIVVAGDGWPAALCGLVAARLVDDHHRPVLALGRDENGRYVGSGRSIPGFDVTGAVRACAEHVVKFGGHPAACGLTIEGDEAFASFREGVVRHAEEALKRADLTPRVTAEEIIAPSDADLAFVRNVQALAPFGEGNPEPVFLLRGGRVAQAQAIGKDGTHLRLTLADANGGRLKLIGFGMADRLEECAPGSDLEALVVLQLNEWNGRVEPQGRLLDLRAA